MCGPKVELVEQPLDDLWIRDSGPIFVKGKDGAAAVDFNFNGWGGKQAHRRDAKVAAAVAARPACPSCLPAVLEGGGIEVDGEGSAIITESCVLQPQSGWSKAQCERELRRLLGVEKVIWRPASPAATSLTATPTSTPVSSAPAWWPGWTRTRSPMITRSRAAT